MADTALGAKLLDSGDYLVTAILPITAQSLSSLQDRISTILDSSLYLHELCLVCDPEHQSAVRQILYEMLSEGFSSYQVDVSIFSWPTNREEGAATLYVAQQIDTAPDRILLLDSNGLENFESATRSMLVGRFATPLPVGPRGYEIHDREPSCLAVNSTPNAASFLVPPFSIAPLLIPPHDLSSDSIFDIWASLGQHISRARYEHVGGVIVDFDETPSWCSLVNADPSSLQLESAQHFAPDMNQERATFAVILSSVDDLLSIATLVCRLSSQGHQIHILLTQEHTDGSIRPLSSCQLKADLLPIMRLAQPHARPETWLSDLTIAPSVVITVLAEDLSSSFSADVTLIRMPREDLPFCDWMSGLPLQAWRNWHKPQLEVSVITNDRPESLSRLLSSLSSSSFFGDTVNLRINVEQTADEETLHVVDSYLWKHGAKMVHRRVVQGGLLPAVVESWYPSSDDSYGLMLEDDVELSPLFYAWIKMALLTYRYGKPEDMSPQLFGISLYQQKNLELRPEGRHPFSAHKLFSAASYPHPNSPYLSQIPCSWGAVYFPEQWREFHDYLSVRLSATHPKLPIDRIVAPGLRSNKWTKSWKKYFIELVYLRGYVMLYPNFRDYVSLSTNHLEIGSHVREMSPEAYERKKKLYLLPLMERPRQLVSTNSEREPMVPAMTGLMDLPDERMPRWDHLPLLDLLGMFATEEILQGRGTTRREELFDCEVPNRLLDIRALLCIFNDSDVQEE
ncbi:hypothetical protein BC835DRAFT_1475019 [Cytidiella melzeri]|nr:hypothetical protein BC835DRAFT_1475019 [Cytidiella melzeri]